MATEQDIAFFSESDMVGQRDVVECTVIAIIVGGNVLLEQAETLARSVNRGHTVSIILAGDSAAYLVRASDSLSELKEALSHTECGYGGCSDAEAMTLAEELAAESENPRVLFFTDRCFTETENLTAVNLDKNEWNVSVDSVSAVRTPEETTFTGILTSRSRSASVSIGFRLGGDLLDARRIELPADTPTEISFRAAALAASDSALAAGLRLHDTVVSAYTGLVGDGSWKPVLSCGDTPVLMTKATDGGRRFTVFSFDLHDSYLPMKPDFALLMKNIVDFSVPALLRDRDHTVGDTVTFGVSDEAEALFVTLPEPTESTADAESGIWLWIAALLLLILAEWGSAAMNRFEPALERPWLLLLLILVLAGFSLIASTDRQSVILLVDISDSTEPVRDALLARAAEIADEIDSDTPVGIAARRNSRGGHLRRHDSHRPPRAENHHGAVRLR